MRNIYANVVMLIMMAIALMRPAWADMVQPVPTVERTYLGLSMGALRDARLTALPTGMVLRAGAVTITEQQITTEIVRANADVQASLKQQRFFVLEQVAAKSLLLTEASAWAKKTGWTGKTENERALLNAYLSDIAKTASVTDEELRAYYEANKDMVGDADFDSVAKELRAYVLEEKRAQAIDRHVQTVSARIPVEVDAAWVASQANTALDNPIDRARRAGKPAVIEFGAEGCRACDMMTPILNSLRDTYGRQCTVLFTNVRKEPILAARYGIETIPVQVFFDKDGREIYRHVGFYPKAEMLAQLEKLGVR